MADFKTHDLLSHPSLSHGFFGRQGGVSKGSYQSLNTGRGSDDLPENVAENRKRVAQQIGTNPQNLLSLWQHHSTDVLIVETSFGKDRPKADGIVTQTPGLALSALAADCGPVLFHDPESQTIGACHAGWRGALNGITEATIKAMTKLGAKRENIRAVLGPCISLPSYEVGPEFRDVFVNASQDYERFFAIPETKKTTESAYKARPHFDLKAFILARLTESGLSQIAALEDCTYAQSETYFSYRYNTHHSLGDYGRNISVIMLTE